MDELEAENTPSVTFEVTTPEPGKAVISIGGELDIASIDELRAAVEPVLASKPKHLTVDVRELRFADSSGIALWVQWASSVESFELREASPLLRRVISSMGLDEKLGTQS
jgi:anti-anti-sigma factor